MRGKGSTGYPNSSYSGITPAHAGKSVQSTVTTASPWDHPRTCGEKRVLGPVVQLVPGSPPHMRGKDAIWVCSTCPAGITPAHAGKSLKWGGLPLPCRDHPRTCGEKCRAAEFYRGKWGSPPHMRGKETCWKNENGETGITPAHAGKRSGWKDKSPRFWDHPRTCGEKQTRAGAARVFAGSPPHMRGKADPGGGVARGCGITPAHAGKRP